MPDLERDYRETYQARRELRAHIRKGKLHFPIGWYIKDLKALNDKLERIEHDAIIRHREGSR